MVTVKQFSDKHSIPYNIVYSATYKIKADKDTFPYVMYKEKELKQAVTSMLEKRLESYKSKVTQTEVMLKLLEE